MDDNRAPTMSDVAGRAGVSRALVSIVFRDQPGASEATRLRVREAAAEIGYAPDQRARLLSRSRSGLIGVVYGLRHEFHHELLEALYGRVEQPGAGLGYEVAVSGFSPTRDEGRAVEGLLAYRCEALLLLGSSLSQPALAALATRVPTVVLARRVSVAGVDVVRTDDVAGARSATEHLLGLGHRDIAFVSGGRVAGDAERRRGYARAMRDAGLAENEQVVRGGLTEQDGSDAADRLPAGPDARPSAVVAFNDRCALGVMTTLRGRGVRVPEDVSVVGYDDTRVARLPWVDLTTVRQDTAAIAAQAVELAVRRVSGPEEERRSPAREVVVAPTLVVRGTSAPLRSGGQR